MRRPSKPRAASTTLRYVEYFHAAPRLACCYHHFHTTNPAFSQDANADSGSHLRTKFTDQSNIRVPGGKAAGPKPIKANYDADDARIVDLKQQGFSDEYVARKLRDEGRIRYVARTVGSRWLRIRKALEAKEEEILEDEMSDWHDGEVSLLSLS